MRTLTLTPVAGLPQAVVGRAEMKAEDVQAHFRAQAPHYAEFMRRIVPFFDEQREVMLRLVPFGDNESFRVLDLGCGPGLFAERLLASYPLAQVTAFDLTSEMLDACRARLSRFDRTVYTLGDFTVDSFGGHYDLIVASLSLQHLEIGQRPDFFDRAYRSLNDGGVFIASEVIVDESPIVRERQYQGWRDYMAGNGENGDVWYQKHAAKDHPASISALISLLGDAGFEAAGCFWRYLNFAVVTADKGHPDQEWLPTESVPPQQG